ncbi:MAG: hypothetical protein ABI652_03850, partial [Acidobacteriota bacterium]
MRWPLVARTVIAAVGVGTAVALYTQTRSRPVPIDRPASAAATPGVTMQSGPGLEVQYASSADSTSTVDRSRVEYQSVARHDDGRVTYTAFRATLPQDGTKVAADTVEMKGKVPNSDLPSDWTLAGHVRWQRPGEMLIESASATYNDVAGIANIPGPMTFSRGTMAGTGVGGTYERSTGNFRVLAEAKVTMNAADGSGQVDATAQTMTFVRADRSMLFDQDAHISREAETLTADRATLYLSDDDQQFKSIELHGGGKVLPAAGKTSNLPEMKGDNISLVFYPDGKALQRAILGPKASMVTTDARGRRSIDANQISFNTAPDGKTLTRLEASEHVVVKTPPSDGVLERTISASTLVASGDDAHGLTAALFAGGADFVESVPATQGHPASKRSGTSQQLTLKLKGQLDAVEEARFQQDVKFRDGDMR